MIRQGMIAIVIAFFTIGVFLGSPLPAIAADYGQSQSVSQQESKSYANQSKYDEAQKSSDYSYTDKQTNQTKPQEKQTNQTNAKRQYAQQAQSYQNKQ
ncbi:MAG: hypothetical protein WBB01_16460 [Phormidesmis sp.]